MPAQPHHTPPAIPAVPSHWRFPTHPTSVRRARQAVTDALPLHARPRLGADLSLLTSELVTNALRYGAHPEDEGVIELVLWAADGHYWLAVSDAGDGKPALPLCPSGSTAENGRGLLLVDALAAAWGVVPRSTRGKSVIAGLRLHR
jgi:two-component sensor histidine kinase